jgi:hypothetical protein
VHAIPVRHHLNVRKFRWKFYSSFFMVSEKKGSVGITLSGPAIPDSVKTGQS